MAEAEVKQWLLNHHVSVQELWLQNTLRFIKQRTTVRSVTELFGVVWEQFLHSELSQSYRPPLRIPVKALKVTLVKPHIFQIHVVRPLPRHIYNERCKNLSESSSSSYVSSKYIEYVIGDGAVQLKAIEFGGPLSIEFPTPPGTKILVYRAFCCSGVLFLSDKNCEVLGGDSKIESAVPKPNPKKIEVDSFDMSIDMRECMRSHNPRTTITVNEVNEIACTPMAKDAAHVSSHLRDIQSIRQQSTTTPAEPKSTTKSHPEKFTPSPVIDEPTTSAYSPRIIYQPIVPQLALEAAFQTARSCEKSKRVKSEQVPSNESMHNVTISSTRSRKSRDLEKAAVGTRQITDFLSVLGERSKNVQQNAEILANRSKEENVRSRVQHSTGSKTSGLVHRSIPPPRPGNVLNDRAGLLADNFFRTPSPQPPNPREATKTSSAKLANKPLPPPRLSKPIQSSVITKEVGVCTTPLPKQNLCIIPYNPSRVQTKDIATSPIHDKTMNRSTSQADTDSVGLTKHSFPEESFHTPPPSKKPLMITENVGRRSHEHKQLRLPKTTPSKALVPRQRTPVVSKAQRNLAPFFDFVPNEVPLASNNDDDWNFHHDQGTFNDATEKYNDYGATKHPVEEATAAFLGKRMFLADILAQRRFWMWTKTILVVPIRCQIHQEIRADEGQWSCQILVTDESAINVLCAVSHAFLRRMLDVDVNYCKDLLRNKILNHAELCVYRDKALNLMAAFARLDVVLKLEVSSSFDDLPTVVEMSQIHQMISSS